MCMMHASLAPICPASGVAAPTFTPPGTAAHRPLVQRRADRPVLGRTLGIAWRRAARWFKPSVRVARRHVDVRLADATPVATAEHPLRSAA